MRRGSVLLRTVRLAAAILSAGAAAAQATSLSGTPVQVNAPPASGFYEFSSHQTFDMGSTAFGVAWKEDLVSDINRLEGERILLRIFRSAGATPVQLKPATRLDLPAENGSKSLLGGRRLTFGSVDVFWTIGTPATSRFRLLRQRFSPIVKSGVPVALHTDMLGSFRSPRMLNLRTGRSLFLWRNGLTTSGRFLSATGLLQPSFGFQVPAGETLLQTAPTTQGFAASTGKSNATFTAWQLLGHSYDGNANLLSTKTVLVPLKPVEAITTTALVRRSDDTVVFIYGLENAAGTVDVFGRAYSPAWQPLTPSVRIVAGLPAGSGGPSAVALDNGEILIAQQKPSGAQTVIEYGRLGRDLHPIGTTARIGPFPVLNNRGITRLENGRVVAAFNKGGAGHFIQFVTP